MTKRLSFWFNLWLRSNRSTLSNCCLGARGTGSKHRLFIKNATTSMTQLSSFGQTDKPTTQLRATLTISGMRLMETMCTMREGRLFCCSSIDWRNTFHKTIMISYVATMVADQHLEVVMTYAFRMTATPATNLLVVFLTLTMFRVPTKYQTISRVLPTSLGPQRDTTSE